MCEISFTEYPNKKKKKIRNSRVTYLKRQDTRITKLRLLWSHHVECGTLLPGMLQLWSANYTTVRWIFHHFRECLCGYFSRTSTTVEFFPFHHCQRNLPAVMYGKNQNDRGKNEVFPYLSPELRILPEETLTPLPFPDIFFYCITLQPVNFSSRETKKISSLGYDDSRINICSLQRHYVKRSFFRYT